MKPRTIEQPAARSQLNGKLCSYEISNTTIQSIPLTHQDARFWLITSGSGKLLMQNRSYPLCPNTLASVLPWQINGVAQISEPLRHKLTTYNYDAVIRTVRIFSNEDGQTKSFLTAMGDHPVVSLSAGDDTVEYLLGALSGELNTDSLCLGSSQNSFHNVNLISISVQMVIHYIRLSREQKTEPDKILTDCTEILRYIYLHCSKKLTLEKLSSLFNYSPSTISSYLTSNTGLSFFDLLNEIRIGKTINFIMYTDFMLREMSKFLGYVDESHIPEVFAVRIDSEISDYREVYQEVQNILRVEETRTVHSMINYIYRNYVDDLNAKDIAHQFGLSVPQMNELLIYQVEQSFTEFLNRIRVNETNELLLIPARTVLETAYEVGCDNPKAFTRNFLKLKEVTPIIFKQKYADNF